MNITQLIAFMVPFVVLLGAIVAGAWLNQRALERQMDAFRSEITAVMQAFKAEVKAEILNSRVESRAENASLSYDSKQTRQAVEKIERQLEAIVSRLILPK